MKTRGYIIVVLGACLTLDVLGDTGKLPNDEQAMKLVAAVLQEGVESLDVTFYATIIEPDKSESEIRKWADDILEDIYGAGEMPSEAAAERRTRRVEMNVARVLKEQRVGRKMKVRVQIDGTRQRMDMVFGKPEFTIFAGTNREEVVPGKEIGADTAFEMTDVKGEDEGVYTHVEYLHEAKRAIIRTEAGKKLERSSIVKLRGMPEEASSMLKRFLCKKESTSGREIYVPDETQIDKLCSGTLDNMSFRILPDEGAPEINERIEISLGDEKSPILKTVLVCDKEDYSKVYFYELQNVGANLPILETYRSDFDSNGFAHSSTEIEYDDEGNIKRKLAHRIESVRVNVAIPNEVFEFSPPDGYTVTDLRLTPAERQAAEIARMKEWLGHEMWKDRLRALVRLEQLLKDNPSELKDIAVSMQGDEHAAVRKHAAVILERVGLNK
jgi:hypothetical protein